MGALALGVAIAPGDPAPHVADAVRQAGGTIVPPAEADALIWTGKGPDGLPDVLKRSPAVTWVQLPSAGIESYASVIDTERVWTCAKGIYARQVAEHALALALAGLHCLPPLAHAHTWQKAVCRDLYGSSVALLGGGGITHRLLELMTPFGATVNVVRRHPQEMPGASRVVGVDTLDEVLGEADVVILALALTAETEHIIGASQLRAMKRDAWLVNVGRGKLVDTDALVDALRTGSIGGAALDVTDPEPLPDGHPLWDFDHCLITPHCANPPALERENFAELVRDNVRRRMAGEPLAGLIDPALGY
jgi:phosphoglycerate dehydrogenase-like enzyme